MTSAFAGIDGKHFTSVVDACDSIDGLNRTCIGVPIRYPDDDGEFTLGFPRKVMNIWEDDRTALNIVGETYQRVQYRDGFKIAEPLIEYGGFTVIGGQLINHGERAVLALESSNVMELGAGDSIVNRIILLSSHDGTGKLELKVTPYRKKTGVAQSLDVPGLSFKHTLKVNARIAAGTKALRRIETAWQEYTEGSKRMMTVKLKDTEARNFIENLLPSKAESVTRIENLRESIYQVYKNTGIGRTNPVCKGTLFGLVQAVAEYTDRKATVRSSDLRNEKACRFDATFLNAGAKKKARAYAAAKKLMSMKGLAK